MQVYQSARYFFILPLLLIYLIFGQTLSHASPSQYRVAVIVSFENQLLSKNIIDAIIIGATHADNVPIKFMFFDAGRNDRLIADAVLSASNAGADIIIGPVFAKSVRTITPLLETLDLHALSLSNDASVASKRVHLLGVPPVKKIDSIAKYLSHIKINNIGLIIPRDDGGIHSESILSNVLPKYKIYPRSISHYRRGDIDSIKNAIHNLARNYKFSYFTDADDNLITGSTDEKRNDKMKDAKRVSGFLDAIYFDCSPNDLLAAIAALHESTIANKNLLTISNDNGIDVLKTTNNKTILSDIIFATNLSEKSSNFYLNFLNTAGYKPSPFAMMAYDAAILSMLFADHGGISACNNNCSFDGAYGAVDIDKNGSVSRMYRVYRNGVTENVLLNQYKMISNASA